jgi:single-strand selective monofunctional uracil DNA glycosylase
MVALTEIQATARKSQNQGRPAGRRIPSRGISGADRAEAWDRAWRRSARRWQSLAPRIAASTGWKIWNPGLYAASWHALFRKEYPASAGCILVFGLNPGPYGMAQTGIPFTDLKRLREHLPRLAKGLERRGCSLAGVGLAPRSLRPYLSRTFESSAVRVYRFLSRGWGSAEDGWRSVVVANPCSLLFMDAAGENRTPADLVGAVSRRTGSLVAARRLRERCNALRRLAAREAVRVLSPRGVVLLGKDAQRAMQTGIAPLLGPDSILGWEHPARAVPDRWAMGLLEEIKRRGWK